MKKLMLSLAAIAVAGITQAASIDWSTDKNAFQMKSGAAANGITVYLLNASAGADYTSLVSGLAKGDVTASNITSQKAYLGSGTTGTGTKKVGKVDQTTATSDALTEGNTYNLSYVVFETIASGTDAGSWYYLSSTSSGSAWKAGTESTQDLASVANWAGSSYTPGNWAKGEVPEPTSGLLLLIGAGMVALRRKQK